MSDKPLPIPDEHVENNGSPTPPKPRMPMVDTGNLNNMPMVDTGNLNNMPLIDEKGKITIPGGIGLTDEMIAQMSNLNAAAIAAAQADALENGGLLADLLFARKQQDKK